MACSSPSDTPPQKPQQAVPASRKKSKPSTAQSDASTEPPHRWSPSPETLKKVAEVAGFSRRVEAQPAPPQRMAFFARNLGFVDRDAVVVLPVTANERRNPCRFNRVSIDEPREVAPLADQTLLILAAKQTVVLDSNCQTTTVLPKVSYIPGNRLLAEPRWPRAFALLDSGSGNLQRFHWKLEVNSHSSILLPMIAVDDPNLRNSECASMRDASLACVQNNRILVGWPGHSTHEIGEVESGTDVVRLFPAERADEMRVLRADSTLEVYRLSAPARRLRRFELPEVPFDIAISPGSIAVLQVDGLTSGTVQTRLVVLEPDGIMRWSIALETLPLYASEQQWRHEYFDCRQVAAHPTRPWIATSNCQFVELYDARNGALLQRMDRGAAHVPSPP